jgi:hypothetical protein
MDIIPSSSLLRIATKAEGMNSLDTFQDTSIVYVETVASLMAGSDVTIHIPSAPFY